MSLLTSNAFQSAEQPRRPRAQLRRSYSACFETLAPHSPQVQSRLLRRFSQDDLSNEAAIRVSVVATKSALLDQEDITGDGKITADDAGPKSFAVGSLHADKFKSVRINGTYMLSNLLQELQLSQDAGLKIALIPLSRITEDPIDRVSRRIRETFWSQLVRRLDASLIGIAARDPKDWTDQPRSRIYVPSEEVEQYNYYRGIANERPDLHLDVEKLPSAPFTAEFVKSLNFKPGILALQMNASPDSTDTKSPSMRGSAFVVPGGRFNELYYWDSYFCCLGLLENNDTSTVEQVVENFNFEIKHYNKVLNANRSYYLGRSQPPFLTDLACRLYEQTKEQPGSKERFRQTILAAIKEYSEVWMSEPRYDPVTGLSRYRPVGTGFPPEVERGHFDHIVGPRARKRNITNAHFMTAYDGGFIKDPELDEYLLHDRGIRESGHDTSYRLENLCANIATVDLNALLYKYETDIAWAIRTFFDDSLALPAGPPTVSAHWTARAAARKRAFDTYLWSAQHCLYLDYDTAARTPRVFPSATTLYALWAGVASAEQAAALAPVALRALEQPGGLACCTAAARGAVGPGRPQRQWDYPFGWAPHQVLAWDGLAAYGFGTEARRLAYRWLRMVAEVAAGAGGALVEKYDVTREDVGRAFRAQAEYGNQGLDFRGVPMEGFGWTNASFTYGLTKINRCMKRALGLGVSFEEYERAKLPL